MAIERIDEAIVARLSSLSVGNRIYPHVLPARDPLPAILYRLKEMSIEHLSGDNNGVNESTYIIYVMASSYSSLNSISDSVDTLMDNWSSTSGTVTIQGCYLAAVRDNPPITVNDEVEFERELEYRIWHS